MPKNKFPNHSSAERIYLIDASIFIFRSWFALPDTITDTDGKPFNAAHGYTHFLLKLLKELNPSYIACLFDESLTTSFRNSIYPDYKANRALPPAELKHQFSACRTATRGLGLAEFADTQLEADDLIASLAEQAHQAGLNVTVVSRDKDLAQCLQPGDFLLDGASKYESYADTCEKYGIKPEQLAEYQALVGDAIDNIPGATGIGPKTALTLLAHYGSLAEMFAKQNTIEELNIRGAKSLRQKISNNREQIQLSHKLAKLVTDQSPVKSIDECQWQLPSTSARETVARQCKLGTNLQRAYCANFI